MKHYGVEEHAPSFCGGGNRIGMLVDLDSPTLLPMRLEVRGAMQELKRLLNIYGEEKVRQKEIDGCRWDKYGRCFSALGCVVYQGNSRRRHRRRRHA